MEESEQPAVERPSNSRTTQACQRCRSLKTRCLPSDQQGTCQRCFMSKRECTWAEISRKAKRTRGPSRISQVEKKIDGLVANLVASEPRLQRTEPPSNTTNAPDVAGLSRSIRPLAPGSWLPVPTSFELIQSPPPEHDQEVEQDQGYLEKLRQIHEFEDQEPNPNIPPRASFTAPSGAKDSPIDDELIQGLLSSGVADNLLYEYRSMTRSFPFIPLLPRQRASDLSSTKPMLLLAILVVASWRDHKLQRKLDEKYRTELANRTIIRPRRTLSLFQSMIVYLAWYHFVFSHKTEQIYTLMQLAIGLALDLGLHQETKRSLTVPERPKPTPPSAEVQRERQRAFLGCYYLSSACSVALMKPNLLKYTEYMGKCARHLQYDREFASDEMIGRLVSLRRIDDQIQDSFFTEDAVSLPISDTGITMSLRILENQLEEWKRENNTEDGHKALELSCAFTDMQLHSIALRPCSPEARAYGETTAQLNALVYTLEAGKRFLDSLLAFPAAEYHVISFSEWMRLPHIVVTLLRLCIPSDLHASIQWDTKAAQDRVRLDLYLESLCYRMQGLSTYDKVKQPHMDFWRAMNMILDLTRTWYCRKIKGGGKEPSSQPTPNNLPTPDAMSNYNPGGADMLGQPGIPGGFPTSEVGAMDLSGLDINNATSSQNPFDLMKDIDFDMDQFLDMGVWGYESYEGMGFGGGHMNF